MRALVLADLVKVASTPSAPVVVTPSVPASTPYPSVPTQLPPPPAAPQPWGATPPYPPSPAAASEPGWAPSYALPDLSPRPLPAEGWYPEALRRAQAEHDFELSLETLDEGW
ncbi:hypothetical protein ACRAWF_31510 [Streptomyces sp. L7]